MRDPFGMRSRILSEPSETTASLVLPPYTKEYIMPLDQDIKAEIINDFQRGEGDTGSPEVQIAILTRRIKDITQHLKAHKHDYASTRGLKKLVGQRRQLMKYLNRKDINRYREVCSKLGLRP